MTRVLVLGAGGYLGRVLCATLAAQDIQLLKPSHREVPVEDAPAVARVVRAAAPDAIVNLAAARPQADEHALQDTNARGAANVAQAAAAVGAHLVHVSTDCVLDGLHAPYHDDAPACPSNAYGRSKARGEAAVQEHAPTATIVRTSLIWDPDTMDRATQGFADRLRAGEPLHLFDDEIRCPLDRATLAEALARLIALRHPGVVNVAGREALSRHAFGMLLLGHFDVPGRDRAQVAHLADLESPDDERRPPDLTLIVDATERLLDMAFEGPHARLRG